MDWLATAFGTEIPAQDILLRFGLACVFGAILGIDREVRERPAGLRTFMMVSLAACLFTIVTLELSMALDHAGDESAIRPDPIRIIEAITAGVAFLAAGSIIRQGDRLEGLTTGAGLWLAGAIGLACGTGYLALATMVTVLAFLILAGLRSIEQKFTGKHK